MRVCGCSRAPMSMPWTAVESLCQLVWVADHVVVLGAGVFFGPVTPFLYGFVLSPACATTRMVTALPGEQVSAALIGLAGAGELFVFQQPARPFALTNQLVQLGCEVIRVTQ